VDNKLFAVILFMLWSGAVALEDLKYGSVPFAQLMEGFSCSLALLYKSRNLAVSLWHTSTAMLVFLLANQTSLALQKHKSLSKETPNMLGSADIVYAGVSALYTGFWWTAVTLGASLGCLCAFLGKSRNRGCTICFVPFLAGAAILCLSLRLGGLIPQRGGLI
jgi:hypothetical protein